MSMLKKLEKGCTSQISVEDKVLMFTCLFKKKRKNTILLECMPKKVKCQYSVLPDLDI